MSRDEEAFGGQGAEVYVAGDTGCADYVAVLVPGSGTNLGNFAALRRAAEQFHERGEREVGRRKVAVVAWLRYHTPPNIPAAMLSSWARDGWEALSSDLAAVSSPRQTVSVIAHSYGSVLAGTLWRNRMPDVDNLVTVGSPGFGAGINSTSQLGGQRVWAGMAKGDDISSWFVPDCCPPFGSMLPLLPEPFYTHGLNPHDLRFLGVCRFRTSDNRGHGTSNGDGTGYWDPDTDSFRNIQRIILGRYSEVTPHSPWDPDCPRPIVI